MNLILMRHGAVDIQEADAELNLEKYFSCLTDDGGKVVTDSTKSLPKHIDVVVYSPVPRTTQTAHMVYCARPNIPYIADARIREISYGKDELRKADDVVTAIRLKQIAGDYAVRFGEWGDNKYDIEYRLTDFLIDLWKKYSNKTVLIITHGTVSSFIKRILNVESQHLGTGKVEEIQNVDIEPVIRHWQFLDGLNMEYHEGL